MRNFIAILSGLISMFVAKSFGYGLKDYEYWLISIPIIIIINGISFILNDKK